MNLIKAHLDKNNLHHAYLIEGVREEIVPEIIEFLRGLGIKTSGNSDFTHINLDSFKIDDARNLKSYGNQKSFSLGKKVFIVSANNFLLEAQNSLLKMFEEPIENTHFFLVVPDIHALLPTFTSRFYVISPKAVLGGETKEAERFIAMPLRDRIEFIKELLVEEDKEDEDLPAQAGGNINLDSARSKALKFINVLELTLHRKVVNNFSGLTLPGVPGGTHTVQNSFQLCLQHIFKVREFLRMPGSSVKTLMESVALVVPEKSF